MTEKFSMLIRWRWLNSRADRSNPTNDSLSSYFTAETDRFSQQMPLNSLILSSYIYIYYVLKVSLVVIRSDFALFFLGMENLFTLWLLNLNDQSQNLLCIALLKNAFKVSIKVTEHIFNFLGKFFPDIILLNLKLNVIRLNYLYFFLQKVNHIFIIRIIFVVFNLL